MNYRGKLEKSMKYKNLDLILINAQSQANKFYRA